MKLMNFGPIPSGVSLKQELASRHTRTAQARSSSVIPAVLPVTLLRIHTGTIRAPGPNYRARSHRLAGNPPTNWLAVNNTATPLTTATAVAAHRAPQRRLERHLLRRSCQVEQDRAVPRPAVRDPVSAGPMVSQKLLGRQVMLNRSHFLATCSYLRSSVANGVLRTCGGHFHSGRGSRYAAGSA